MRVNISTIAAMPSAAKAREFTDPLFTQCLVTEDILTFASHPNLKPRLARKIMPDRLLVC